MTSPEARRRFEEEVLPLLGAAYNLARWLLRDAHDADDAVQDAMLRAFRYAEGWRGENPRAWLFAIVRNTCFSWRSRHRSTNRLPFPGDGSALPEAALAQADPASPETVLSDQGEREHLHRALTGLPDEFREVLVLRELEGCSYKEIGAVVGIPIGTVMSRLSRARNLLKERLTETLLTERKRG